MNNPIAPLSSGTDETALERLRTLPGVETERLVNLLDTLPTAAARQDRLIGEYRIALSLSALEAWLAGARREREERRFREFLADVRQAAERAEAFRELLAGAEALQQVNIALLAARLFDALVARDAEAIEQFAHTFAEVLKAAGNRGTNGPAAKGG